MVEWFIFSLFALSSSSFLFTLSFRVSSLSMLKKIAANSLSNSWRRREEEEKKRKRSWLMWFSSLILLGPHDVTSFCGLMRSKDIEKWIFCERRPNCTFRKGKKREETLQSSTKMNTGFSWCNPFVYSFLFTSPIWLTTHALSSIGWRADLDLI